MHATSSDPNVPGSVPSNTRPVSSQDQTPSRSSQSEQTVLVQAIASTNIASDQNITDQRISQLLPKVKSAPKWKGPNADKVGLVLKQRGLNDERIETILSKAFNSTAQGQPGQPGIVPGAPAQPPMQPPMQRQHLSPAQPPMASMPPRQPMPMPAGPFPGTPAKPPMQRQPMSPAQLPRASMPPRQPMPMQAGPFPGAPAQPPMQPPMQRQPMSPAQLPRASMPPRQPMPMQAGPFPGAPAQPPMQPPMQRQHLGHSQPPMPSMPPRPPMSMQTGSFAGPPTQPAMLLHMRMQQMNPRQGPIMPSMPPRQPMPMQAGSFAGPPTQPVMLLHMLRQQMNPGQPPMPSMHAWPPMPMQAGPFPGAQAQQSMQQHLQPQPQGLEQSSMNPRLPINVIEPDLKLKPKEIVLKDFSPDDDHFRSISALLIQPILSPPAQVLPPQSPLSNPSSFTTSTTSTSPPPTKKRKAITNRRLPFSKKNGETRFNLSACKKTIEKVQLLVEGMDSEMPTGKELPKLKVDAIASKAEELHTQLLLLQEFAVQLLNSQREFLEVEKKQEGINPSLSLLGKRIRNESSSSNTESSCYIHQLQNSGERIKAPLMNLENAREMAKRKHIHQLAKYTYNEKETKGNVEFIVGNSSFKAHKEILSQNSSYFKTMFNGQFHESQTQLKIPLEVPGLSPELFEKLLAYIYTGELEILDVSEAINYLVCADYFFLEDLKKDCVNYIDRNLCCSTALQLFEISVQNSCRTAKDHILPFICLNAFHSFFRADDEQLGQLGIESLALILLQDELSLAESEIIQVVYNWLSIRVKNEGLSQVQIIQLNAAIGQFLRLPLCSYDELYDDWEKKTIEGVLLFDETHFEAATVESIRNETPKRKLASNTFSLALSNTPKPFDAPYRLASISL